MVVPKSRSSSIAYDTTGATFEGFLASLEQRRWPLFPEGTNQFRTFCPTCESDESNSPSLAIGRSRSGTALLFCFSSKEECGLGAPNGERNPKDIRRAFEAFTTVPVPRNAMRKYRRRHVPGKSPMQLGAKQIARYEYPDGSVKIRWAWRDAEDGSWDKDFRWPQGRQSSGPMLYQPPTDEERREEIVVLVEGEKDCDRLRSLGFVSTTVSEGYLTPRLAKQYLQGCTVAVLRDYDRHGKRARDVALEVLDGIAEQAFFVHLPGLKQRRDQGADVSDWLDDYDGSARELVDLITAAEKRAR